MPEQAVCLVLWAHPEPVSLVGAIAQRVSETLRAAGNEVHDVDLYRYPIDPTLSGEELRRHISLDPAVQEHSRLLSTADLLVIVHPNWWGGPPAILKGWLDRVLRPGFAYEYEGLSPQTMKRFGLLDGKHALVIVPGDGGPEDQDFLDGLWNRRILSFCGVNPVIVRSLGPVRGSSRRQREEWISDVAADALRLAEGQWPA